MSKLVAGIDLGTTFSAIAYVDDAGLPHVVPNVEGQPTTPSVVLLDEGSVLVGELALNQAATRPERVVRWIKRAMGRPEYRFQGLTAAQISAEILRKLRRDAEQFLGTSMTSAVITCPAYFSSLEVEATKLAGEIAELQVLEIIKEPTAAAVYYGVDHLRDGQKLLVYDLGGGTFDATILLLEDRVFKPLATTGHRRLGGHDWTSDLMERVCKELAEHYGEDPRIDPIVEYTLYEQCERAKRDLSRLEEVVIPCVYQGRAEEVRVTRDEFEEMTEWRIVEMVRCVERALCKPEQPVTWADIHEILLVGGATRMPRVRTALRDISGKEPTVAGEADTIVALGAAILGKGTVLPRADRSALMAAGADSGIVAVRFDRTASRTLGTKAVVWIGSRPEIRNSSIIEYGTRLPASVTRSDYQIITDGQESFDVPIVEYDDLGPEVIMGTYRFACLPRTRSGTPIAVTFSYDGSGIATVTAVDQAAKQELPHTRVAYQPPDPGTLNASKTDRVIMFVLDVSVSMEGDKIRRAREALIDAVKALGRQSRGTTKIGVVTFGSEAECVCQPSLDLDDVCRRVEKSAVVGGSTAMHAGIAVAASVLRRAAASAKCEIALVTDGMPDDPAAALAAAERARSHRIELCAVGIGKDDVDEDYLEQIAPRALTIEEPDGLGAALMSLLMEASNRNGRTNVVVWGERE